MNEEITTQLDKIIVGKPIDEIVPIFASYLANMGFFGTVPKDVLKNYICEIIDNHYSAHCASKEKLQ